MGGVGFAKEHWASLTGLISVLDKGEKEASKKYDALEKILCRKESTKETQSRLLWSFG